MPNKKGLAETRPCIPLRNTHQIYFGAGYRICQVLSFFEYLYEEDSTMRNSKQTSKSAASAASAVLRDGRTSAKSKTAAGSALAQRASKKTK